MGSCNGHTDTIDSVDEKKMALEASLKAVEVAKNQQAELLQKFKEIYDYFQLDSLESQDHWFLELPEEVSEVRQLGEHLKRFSITIDQILLEESVDDSYRESFVSAKYQISQLTEYLHQLELLVYGFVDEVYPSLPEDLNTDTSQSARQTRDYLVIRDYGQLLDLIHKVLSDYQ